jgi:uncharacterized membrane protein YjjP (DUF1212 family)
VSASGKSGWESTLPGAADPPPASAATGVPPSQATAFSPIRPPLGADAEAFLFDAGEALHRLGLPAHRLEATVVDVAGRLGTPVQVLSMPTSLIVAFGEAPDQRIGMVRVSPAEPDLGRLAAVDALMAQLGAGLITVGEAHSRLRATLRARPAWSGPAMVAVWALVSGAAAVLFGGDTLELALAGALGGLLGLLDQLGRRVDAVARALTPLAAVLVTLVAQAAASGRADLDPGAVILGGLIVFFPGLTFTVGMMELATYNLVSGVARLASAAQTLLLLIIGVALGQALAEDVPAWAWGGAVAPLPEGAVGVATVLAAVGFGMLLQARPRDLPLTTGAALFAFATARAAGASLGPEAAAGVGAFALGLASNGWARLANRTATVPLVPGVLLLVPGSLGFRSLTALLGGDVVGGVDQAFQMAVTAISLAIGLVIATSVLPPRRPL